MFEYIYNKKKRPTFFLISVILHIIIFSLLILIPDTREYPKEEITEVVIPEPLKKPIHYPEKKVVPIKKRKVVPKTKKQVIKKSQPQNIKQKSKNDFSFKKEKRAKSQLKQGKIMPQKKLSKLPPQIKKKKLKRVPINKTPVKKRRLIVVPDKEPKGPIKGKDDLPPGNPGKGGDSLYKGLSKIKPKVKKKGFVIPYGGKNRFSFKLGEGIGGGSGWKNYGASVSFDTHGINLDPWIKEVIRKVKSNWIIPTAAKYGLKGYNAFYLVFEKNGSLGVFKIIIKSKVLSFNLSSSNAIKGSVPFPPIPDYYPYKNVKARFLFYYNLYPQEN